MLVGRDTNGLCIGHIYSIMDAEFQFNTRTCLDTWYDRRCRSYPEYMLSGNPEAGTLSYCHPFQPARIRDMIKLPQGSYSNIYITIYEKLGGRNPSILPTYHLGCQPPAKRFHLSAKFQEKEYLSTGGADDSTLDD